MNLWEQTLFSMKYKQWVPTVPPYPSVPALMSWRRLIGIWNTMTFIATDRQYLYPDIWFKLLCSSRSSLRADILVEKSTGRDVNWFQLRSSFSRNDREKNACGKRRHSQKDREKYKFNYCVSPSFSLSWAQTNNLHPLSTPLLFPVQHCVLDESIILSPSSIPSFLPVVVCLVSDCWPALEPVGTTVQWKLECQSNSDCFLLAPAAMRRAGGPWERARTHGYDSPPGHRARNKRTDVDTTTSHRRMEKGMEGNKRQEGRGEGGGKWDTYFLGRRREGRKLWKVEWSLVV